MWNKLKTATCYITLFYSYGCVFAPLVIDKPIRSLNAPNVSVRYTYNAITLMIPLVVLEKQPNAYKVSIFQKGKMATPVFERTFQPQDTIKLVMPLSNFSAANFDNVIRLEPIGDDFEIAEQFFHIPEPGIFIVNPMVVRLNPIVIKGIVVNRINRNPIPGATVSIADSNRTYVTLKTDSIGFFRCELNKTIIGDSELFVRVTTKKQFTDYLERIPAAQNNRIHLDIELGVSAEFAGRGNLFRVKSDLVPFRVGPENGSPIQMFLAQGEMFIATKVSGDRMFGYVEYVDLEKSIREEFSGWVLSRDLELVE
ncbi:MAG: hypothetical protein ACE5D8_09290 [Fidelibacterota bacterium]